VDQSRCVVVAKRHIADLRGGQLTAKADSQSAYKAWAMEFAD